MIHMSESERILRGRWHQKSEMKKHFNIYNKQY